MARTLQKMWVSLDDQRWLLDEKTWELKDWFVIKAACGLPRIDFLNGVVDEDPAAIQALVWFLRKKAGDEVPLATVQFLPASLGFELVEDDDADPPSAGAVAEPASPPTSETDVTTTSPPSPPPSATTPGMSTP